MRLLPDGDRQVRGRRNQEQSRRFVAIGETRVDDLEVIERGFVTGVAQQRLADRIEQICLAFLGCEAEFEDACFRAHRSQLNADQREPRQYRRSGEQRKLVEIEIGLRRLRDDVPVEIEEARSLDDEIDLAFRTRPFELRAVEAHHQPRQRTVDRILDHVGKRAQRNRPHQQTQRDTRQQKTGRRDHRAGGHADTGPNLGVRGALRQDAPAPTTLGGRRCPRPSLGDGANTLVWARFWRRGLVHRHAKCTLALDAPSA